MTGGLPDLPTDNPAGSQTNRVSEADVMALLAEAEIGFGRLTLTPGARWESIDLTRRDYATIVARRPAGARPGRDRAALIGLNISL